MEEQELLKTVDKYKSTIQQFFPGRFPSGQSLVELFERGNCLTFKKDIVPYLQTAFFDEQICELEIVGLTRVYFCRIWDHLPELYEEENEEGEIITREPEYNSGDYLKEMNHIVLSPVEPGIGNFYILGRNNIILRTFTSSGTTSVEYGISFFERMFVRGRACLQFVFPSIAVITSGARSFRATVSENFKVEVKIPIIKRKEPYVARLHNISTKGMGFIIEKEHQQYLEINQKREVEILAPQQKPIKVICTIRHVSKVRDKKSIQYRCGVRFDLANRALALEIERLMTKVQRIHLQELAEKSYDVGIDLF